jgi:hypothetical protein
LPLATIFDWILELFRESGICAFRLISIGYQDPEGKFNTTTYELTGRLSDTSFL